MRQEVEQEIRGREQIPSALSWASLMVERGLQRGPVVMRLGRPRRTLDQNRKLWPMCQDVAHQVEWHGQLLSKEDWKDLFVGSLRGQTPMPGINGGVVFIGGGSSKLSVRQFVDLIESIYAFGSDHGVIWSERSKEAIQFAKSRRDGRGVRA